MRGRAHGLFPGEEAAVGGLLSAGRRGWAGFVLEDGDRNCYHGKDGCSARSRVRGRASAGRRGAAPYAEGEEINNTVDELTVDYEEDGILKINEMG